MQIGADEDVIQHLGDASEDKGVARGFGNGCRQVKQPRVFQHREWHRVEKIVEITQHHQTRIGMRAADFVDQSGHKCRLFGAARQGMLDRERVLTFGFPMIHDQV